MGNWGFTLTDGQSTYRFELQKEKIWEYKRHGRYVSCRTDDTVGVQPDCGLSLYRSAKSKQGRIYLLDECGIFGSTL